MICASAYTTRLEVDIATIDFCRGYRRLFTSMSGVNNLVGENNNGGLRSTRSTANSKVTLITLDPPADTTKPEPHSPLSAPSESYISMRRSTRSTTTTTSIDLQTPSTTSPNAVAGPSRTRDLSSYAYNDPSTPPRKRVKVELEENVTPVTGATLKTPRSGKKPMPQLALEKAHPEPARWREQYQLIERMRKGIIAPVDTM